MLGKYDVSPCGSSFDGGKAGSKSGGAPLIERDDKECGDRAQEKAAYEPAEAATILGLRQSRIYQGQGAPADYVFTC